MTSPSAADPYVELRERLTITRNPFLIIASPLAWRCAVYAVTAVFVGGSALLLGILGLIFLPWIAHVTTQIERHRMVLLGLPSLVAAAPVRPGWRATFAGRGEAALGVWAITAVFGLINAIPAVLLAVAVYAGVLGVQSSFEGGIQPVVLALSLGWLFFSLTVGLYVAWVLAAGQAYVEQSMLLPYSSLTRQVVELTSSRSELVDVFEAERRRIERDLHDGAQQHLVVSTMRLGEAVYWLDQDNPDGARGAVLGAQTALEDALAALRNTIRGIHPQVLSDRGLVAALQELAARQPVPTSFVYHGTPRALPQQVESAAYYMAAEALTNVAKHSGASQAQLVLVFADQELRIELTDDGRGGARWVPGHGISGLAERTQTAAGNFTFTSPEGGPTRISVTLPYDRTYVAGTG
ncbi:histidine kinase [Propionicimonas sp.]|uniref:sensor histidine kinase n=1 Tax=Propionicimonas sp. TaxID=1955623 RepID=UPI00183E714A|nr:histidine kinase [Propionicimonas sp.]MBU3975731.1 sensor histidine kinase [Actinomycetota bacterium]MBA3019866.1 sensor histidine kinase [Propionicimonas sp.]MBU3986120.1 sensor histidine kinase [Actinomycetota bacterium]MBU4007447.1 sensor histidine kinase [Actinomycetota bacterium]MBU4063947.1 sensor histidine kinase [Actinomycetota bacterium]